MRGLPISLGRTERSCVDRVFGPGPNSPSALTLRQQAITVPARFRQAPVDSPRKRRTCRRWRSSSRPRSHSPAQTSPALARSRLLRVPHPLPQKRRPPTVRVRRLLNRVWRCLLPDEVLSPASVPRVPAPPHLLLQESRSSQLPSHLPPHPPQPRHLPLLLLRRKSQPWLLFRQRTDLVSSRSRLPAQQAGRQHLPSLPLLPSSLVSANPRRSRRKHLASD